MINVNVAKLQRCIRLFYEEFRLEEAENHLAEYESDSLKIIYYLGSYNDGISHLIKTIEHEWLHGLFDWATEGATNESEKTNGDKDHFIMSIINFE